MNFLAIAIALPFIIVNWTGKVMVALTEPVVDWLLGSGGSDN